MGEGQENGMEVNSLNENKFKNPMMKENEEMLETGIKRRKWFDKGLFNDDISSSEESLASEDAGELDEGLSGSGYEDEEEEEEAPKKKS